MPGMPTLFIIQGNKSNEVEEIMIQGMPLGAIKNFDYEVREENIEAGDTLLMMSDGFPELQNNANEQIGYKRVKNLFKEIAFKPSDEIITRLKDEGSRWVQENDPDDDVTFVVIKVK